MPFLTRLPRLYLRRVTVTLKPPRDPGKTIRDLRVSFECEKTNEAAPNTLTLEIYNLAEDSRGMLEGEKTRVILEVGYQDTIESLFVGNLAQPAVVHKQEGPDVVTTIQAEDGGNRYRNAKIDRGFPPGVRMSTVFDELQRELGLGRGSVVGIPPSQYANGLTLSGLVRNQLNELARKNDLEWSIQDEKLQIISSGSTTTEAPILLTPETGLVGIPNKTAKGVEFTSLLQPSLRPGRRVKIESRNLNGTFKIQRVVHRGDSHFGKFLSRCETTV